jgi:hypothetical protein
MEMTPQSYPMFLLWREVDHPGELNHALVVGWSKTGCPIVVDAEEGGTAWELNTEAFEVVNYHANMRAESPRKAARK